MALPGRDVEQDIKHGSKLVGKFANYIMQDGNKNLAYKIIYGAFSLIEEREGEPGVKVFREAIDNISPDLETRSRRVGGANYQVPYEVSSDRQVALSFRWLVDVASSRNEPRMEERLASEIILASNKEGEAYERKLESHRRAEANKAFAHYRW
ncbi:30S ribosomal protein S7 [Candidatus Bipolaricaulota bacterium]|nr:30S ribosomal protein S7 [Candidatus Bipolaricaulota bacterium]